VTLTFDLVLELHVKLAIVVQIFSFVELFIPESAACTG